MLMCIKFVKSEFGKAEIGTLVDHFRLHITEEKDEVIQEWQLLKSLLYQRYFICS